MIDVTNRYISIGVSIIMILTGVFLILLCHHKHKVNDTNSNIDNI